LTNIVRKVASCVAWDLIIWRILFVFWGHPSDRIRLS